MSKKVVFLFILFYGYNAYGQEFQWAKSFGSTVVDFPSSSITVDKQGNVYTSGQFTGTVDFDPGPNVYNLVSNGGYDIYISKLDANGNFVWAKNFGSTTDDNGTYIALDSAGNVYTTGFYSAITDFDPGAGLSYLGAVGNDIFISKLDSAGNFKWAKRVGGSNNDAGRGIAIDGLGNSYIIGSFSGTVDFDPGSGIYELSSATSNGNNGFFMKLDSLGNFIWAKNLGTCTPFYFAISPSKSFCLTGTFNGTNDFDPGTAINNLTTSTSTAFVLKLDSLGSFKWVKAISGTNGITGTNIAVDKNENLLMTGDFSSGDFDPGPAVYTLTTNGSNDFFVMKLDSMGNFKWAKAWGSTYFDYGSGIALDKLGNVYTTGYFGQTVDFDPGPGVTSYTAIGTEVYVLKLDNNGNFISAKQLGKHNTAPTDFTNILEGGKAIFVDENYNIYTSGTLLGTGDFDPGTGVYNLTSNGNVDCFVSKLSQTVLPITLMNFQVTRNGNDALLNWQTATETNNDKFEVEKSTDGIVFNKIGYIKAAGNSNKINDYQYTDYNALLNSIKQTIYYRFKQVDMDGRFVHSPIRSLRFTGKQYAVQVYPNPAKDYVTIQVSSIETNLPYTVVDKAGRKVLGGQIKNSNNVTLNIAQLPAGTYFVEVGDNKQATKFIKQ